MKLKTQLIIAATTLFIINCGGGSNLTTTQNAKEILTSHKWYESKDCQNKNYSKEFTFLENRLITKEYNNSTFEGEATQLEQTITFQEQEVYLKIDNKDLRCLVSSDSNLNWANLSCIPTTTNGNTTTTIALYKSINEAIENNQELCVD